VIRQLGCVVGTVRVQRGEDLYLTAAQNIPPQVLAIVAHVPHGKGMAGAAQVKKAPVQTCNLQDGSDRSVTCCRGHTFVLLLAKNEALTPGNT
jgi:hypothetical protein